MLRSSGGRARCRCTTGPPIADNSVASTSRSDSFVAPRPLGAGRSKTERSGDFREVSHCLPDISRAARRLAHELLDALQHLHCSLRRSARLFPARQVSAPAAPNRASTKGPIVLNRVVSRDRRANVPTDRRSCRLMAVCVRCPRRSRRKAFRRSPLAPGSERACHTPKSRMPTARTALLLKASAST